MERQQKQRPHEDAPWEKQGNDPLGGPHAPQTQKPDTNSILKKLKTVDKGQSKRYKQRSGQAL